MAHYASTGELRGILIATEICKEYGWTYDEFQKTDKDFINLILDKKRIDYLKSKQQTQ